MLPTSFETFDFLDMKHNRTYSIERDIKGKNEIEITEDAARSYFAPEQTREILIYSQFEIFLLLF
ncbi:MAG: hypothetical protein A4E53_01346 [Pelotomaculum sp. PtaB.Bin104]|nr:MAG: hypothetical protein A4E53_01346 [Pelotomaculum sp. PtaB.Bin104]